MRQFVVLGHDAAADPDFTLNDLPGSAGRLDVLCRCVNSAFFLSHDLRDDVRVHLVLQDRYIIRFEGSELQYLNPDERQIAAMIQKALEKAQVTDVSDEQESTPGIYIKEHGFTSLLEQIDGALVQLHEEGEPLPSCSLPNEPVFVLSDHNTFTDGEETVLREHNAKQVSVGPLALHADHAITVVQNYLDTDAYQQY